MWIAQTTYSLTIGQIASLALAHGAGAMRNLAVYVAELDRVDVEQTQRANAARAQIESRRTSEASASHDEGTLGLELLLG